MKIRVPFFFILIVSLSSCFSKMPVEFQKIDKLRIANEDNTLLLNFDLVIHNPNNWGLRITRLESELLFDKKFFGQSTLEHSVHVARNSGTSLPLSVRTNQADLIKFLPQGLTMLLGKQSMTAVVRGKITFGKFIFRKKIPFELNERINSDVLKNLFSWN